MALLSGPNSVLFRVYTQWTAANNWWEHAVPLDTRWRHSSFHRNIMAPFPTDLLHLIKNRCSQWLGKMKTIENNHIFCKIQAFCAVYSSFVVLFVATVRSWLGVGMKSSSCEALWLQPRANVTVSAMSVSRCSRRSWGSARRWMTCAKSPRWSKRRLSCRWVTFLPIFHSNISVKIHKKSIKAI